MLNILAMTGGMKTPTLTLSFILLLITSSVYISADTSAPADASSPDNARKQRMFSFLSQPDRDKFFAAEDKVMAENPGLKAERDDLVQQMKASDGSPSPELIQSMIAHRKKVRQAMLKDDPSLAPIFAQIEKHWTEARAAKTEK